MYERNNKKHPKKQIKKLIKSIKENEYITPIIVDEDKVILAGHGRLIALKEMERDKVEVLMVSGLNDMQKRKFRLLDNRIADYSTYDLDNLMVELSDLMEDDIMDEFENMDIFKDMESEEEVELEFSEELYESHNYVILVFDNDVDWQTAKEKLGLKTVKAKDAKP